MAEEEEDRPYATGLTKEPLAQHFRGGALFSLSSSTQHCPLFADEPARVPAPPGASIAI